MIPTIFTIKMVADVVAVEVFVVVEGFVVADAVAAASVVGAVAEVAGVVVVGAFEEDMVEVEEEEAIIRIT
jgi:hypothetical protein